MLVLETVSCDYFGLFIWIYICIKIFIRGESWPKLRRDYLLEVELTVSHNRSRNFWNDISAL